MSKEVLPIAGTYETGVEITEPQTHLGSYRPLLPDHIKICMWWFLTKGQKQTTRSSIGIRLGRLETRVPMC